MAKKLRSVISCCIAAFIGVSFILLPVLYLNSQEDALGTLNNDAEQGASLEYMRYIIKVNEKEYSQNSLIGYVPLYPILLIVVIGLFAGIGVYLRARLHFNTKS